MVRGSYYTFRPITLEPLRFECTKWEDYDSHPQAMYIVNTYRNSCTCPASHDCKHIRLVREILDADVVDQMHQWIWDEKNEWTRMDDIPTIEEMLECLNG